MAHRGGAVFVADWREHSRPLDRNAIAKILFLAETLERNTKMPGKRSGCLGYIGLAVLRCLLLQFLNRATGLCCPSYDQIQARTGLCRQSISRAISRLEAHGCARVVRRLCRQRVGNVVLTTNATSLYSFWQPTCSFWGLSLRNREEPRQARTGKGFPRGRLVLGEALNRALARFGQRASVTL